MATPQEIQKLLDKLDKAYKQLGTKNPFKDWDSSNLKDAGEAAAQLEDALEGVQSRVENTSTSFKDLASTLGAIVKEIDPKAANATKSFTTGFKNIIKEAKQLQYEEEGINKLSKKQLETLQERIKKQQFLTKEAAELLIKEAKVDVAIDRRTKAYKTLNDAQKAAVNYLKEEDQTTQSILDKTQQRIDQETRINKLLGLGGAVIGGIQTALDKMGFGGLSEKLGLDEVKKKMREVAEEIESAGGNTDSFSNKFKVLKVGVKEAGKNLVENLKDPLTASVFLVTKFTEALASTDKMAGDTAKSFNMSYQDALKLNHELNTTANLTLDAAVNTKGLNESLIAVGQSLGSNAKLNEKDLVTFTKLREQAGFTNDELIGIQKLSLVNGKTLEDNTSEILGSAKAYASQNKLIVNEKEILKEVNKASASLKLSLGGSTAALAESAVKAKQFGLSLEQAGDMAQSLLNFESSISSELEAELLTGKDLNFEKARLLALNGKTADAAAEIAKQLGTSADFGKMNVIQQEALAKAAGMTRDQLAQSLIESEALTKLSGVDGENAKEKFDNLVKQTSMEEAKRRLGDEQLAIQFEQQSVQDRFAQSMQKLQEIFVALAEPVLAIVSPFMNLVENILPLINVILLPVTATLSTIGELLGEIIGFLTEAQDTALVLAGTFGAILAYQYRSNIATAAGIALDKTKALFAKREAGMTLGQAVLGAIKSVVSTPIVGPLLAAAAAAGVYALGKKYLVDDAVIPGGYGKRVLSAPEGTIAFNDNDTIVAGTNLEGKKKGSRSGGSSIDISPLVERMAAVESILLQIANKEGSVYLDGTKVGTAMAMSTYKTQ
jgi:hypothetical protein